MMLVDEPELGLHPYALSVSGTNTNNLAIVLFLGVDPACYLPSGMV
jgi:hypothetical protein